MSIRSGRYRIGRKRKLVGLLTVALAIVIGASAYAFTASNTIPEHSAGAGSAGVTGYTVSSPTSYTFSGNGTTMTGVTFDLNHAASDVKVALTPGEPEHNSWSDCGASVGGGNEVTCTFVAPVPDGEGDKLSVAAVSSGVVTIGP